MMVIARAPVRISFAGGGTDLEAYYAHHGGLVVSAAITRYCYAIARPSHDGGIQITSADYQHWETHPAGTIPEVAEPLALPKAAIEWFATRGLLDDGVDLFLASSIPPGTGLGSSSAVAVAVVRALASFTGMLMDPGEVAELACELEIERLKMPIGKQDQYASAFGGLNAIHFGPDTVQVEPIELSPRLLEALSSHLLLFSTGKSRNSAEILRQQRADTTEKKPVVSTSLHQLKATAEELRQALLAERIDDVGELLDLGWQQKKRLSDKISSGAIDRWYRLAREQGALGGKITGAGGGGFMLLYCEPECRDAVRNALVGAGLREMSFGFDVTGAQEIAELDTRQSLLAASHD
jgi:D-glycero-alpha-D-manno-heptose-7-phosphate kinase